MSRAAGGACLLVGLLVIFLRVLSLEELSALRALTITEGEDRQEEQLKSAETNGGNNSGAGDNMQYLRQKPVGEKAPVMDEPAKQRSIELGFEALNKRLTEVQNQLSTIMGKDNKLKATRSPITSSSEPDHCASSYANIQVFPREEARNNEMYSSVYCVNGEPRESFIRDHKLPPEDWANKECVFRNLGLDENGTFFFHQNPDIPTIWGYVLGSNTPYKTPPASFWSNRNLAMRILEEPISVVNKTYANELENDVILGFRWCSSYGNHPGHDYEVAWNTYNTMANTGMMSIENGVVLYNAPTGGCRVTPSKAWELLSRNLSDFETWRAKAKLGGLLFKSITIGKRPARLSMTEVLASSVATQFRNRVYCLMSIPQTTRSIPRIGIRYKKSRHRFVNHQEIIDAIRKTYASLVEVVEIKPERTTMKQEVSIIANLDVYITPGGGGSFSSIFIGNGRTTIYGNTCWPGRPKHIPNSDGILEFDRNGTVLHCYRVESFVFASFQHFYKYFIGANSTSDLIFDAKEAEVGGTRESAAYAYSYNVSINQVLDYVNIAFAKAGFNLPPIARHNS